MTSTKQVRQNRKTRLPTRLKWLQEIQTLFHRGHFLTTDSQIFVTVPWTQPEQTCEDLDRLQERAHP